MAHDHHFLSRLDRLASVHLDLAMELYRDPELVREVLRRNDGHDDRVAIALDQGGVGPYVVVSSEGRFVTCLARGMSPGTRQVLERNKLDEAIAHIRTVRERASMLSKLRPDNDEDTLAARLGTAGEFLSREEMMGLLALRPVYQYALYDWATSTCRLIPERLLNVIRIVSPKPKYGEAIKAYYRIFWAAGHLGVLWGADSHRLDAVEGSRELLGFISRCAYLTGCRPIALRGIYAVTGDADAALELSHQLYFKDHDAICILQAIHVLVALGLRSPKHEREVRSILRTDPEGLSEDNRPSNRWVRKVAFQVLDREGPDPLGFEAVGREQLFRMTRRLPEGAPGRYATESDIPANVARALAFSVMAPAFGENEAISATLTYLPLLVGIRPEDFYLPASVLKALYCPWSTALGMRVLNRCQASYAHKVGVKPVEHTPGPNEPCSCGSGKKYKKCCGAPG